MPDELVSSQHSMTHVSWITSHGWECITSKPGRWELTERYEWKERYVVLAMVKSKVVVWDSWGRGRANLKFADRFSQSCLPVWCRRQLSDISLTRKIWGYFKLKINWEVNFRHQMWKINFSPQHFLAQQLFPLMPVVVCNTYQVFRCWIP